MYSIGDPWTGRKEPKQYEKLEDAEIAALEKSELGDLWGVWDEDDGELVSLAFGQKVFN